MPTARTAPRKATGLLAAALEAEKERHAARLKELRAATHALELLDAHAGAFAAAGVRIYGSQVSYNRHGRVLFVSPSCLSSGESEKLRAVLLAAGFQEAVQHDYGTWLAVHLVRGRLTVGLHVDKPRTAAPVAAAPAAAATQPEGVPA